MTTQLRARVRRWSPAGLAALFIGSGTLHLVRPGIFLPTIPHGLPARDAAVLVSGIAELACAVGLLSNVRGAGAASALLLIAVFPANVQFAVEAAADPSASRLLVAVAVARLPLQLPLIWAALQAR